MAKVTTAEALLSQLQALRMDQAQAERMIREIIERVREPDLHGYCLCSWQEIADALGVKKQSAMERYSS